MPQWLYINQKSSCTIVHTWVLTRLKILPYIGCILFIDERGMRLHTIANYLIQWTQLCQSALWSTSESNLPLLSKWMLWGRWGQENEEKNITGENTEERIYFYIGSFDVFSKPVLFWKTISGFIVSYSSPLLEWGIICESGWAEVAVWLTEQQSLSLFHMCSYIFG